jgi:hypothetical protein
MTSEQTTTTPLLVFENEAGDYFVVPQKLLERVRVPAEHKAEVEQLIAASDDASGYSVPMAVSWLRIAGHAFNDGMYPEALKMVGYAIEEVRKELDGGPAW